MTDTVKIGISRVVLPFDIKCGFEGLNFDVALSQLQNNDLYNPDRPITIHISQNTGVVK